MNLKLLNNLKYNEYQNISELLSKPKKIVLTAHANPDGDTIGSCLALFHFLVQFGHEVKVVSPNAAPSFINWLPGYESILVFDLGAKKATQAINDAEIIFAVD